MKHVVLTLMLGSIAGFNSNAQELYLVSGGGTYTEDTGGSISWSLGEPIIVTASGTSNDITQGFQQGNIFVTGIEDLREIEVSIFPNPTRDFVTIMSPGPIQVSVYDPSGRLVAVHSFNASQNQLDVTSLARGTYTLIIESEDLGTKTSQLVVM